MNHNECVILGALGSGYITVDHLEHNKTQSTPQLLGIERNFLHRHNDIMTTG